MAGRQQEAIAPLEKALRINPIAPSIYFKHLGTAYRDTGHYEEAIAQLKKALERTPDNLFTHVELAATYSLSGRDDEARAEAAEVLRTQPNFSLKSIKPRQAFTKIKAIRIVSLMPCARQG